MTFDAYKKEKPKEGISSACQIYERQLIWSRRERKEKKIPRKKVWGFLEFVKNDFQRTIKSFKLFSFNLPPNYFFQGKLL